DFAAELERDRPYGGLRFLQVEQGEGAGSYQFIDGVARTSLASETARRLGVTFEELAEQIEGPRADSPAGGARSGGESAEG
ncbi:MAG: hypothetical protein AAF725_11675, partial [Acidobacteriota bacterium]